MSAVLYFYLVITAFRFLPHCTIAEDTPICEKLQLAIEAMVQSHLHAHFVTLNQDTD